MDADDFDTLTRSLTDRASRRRFVGGLATAFGLGATEPFTRVSIAKKGKRKRKKKPLQLNTFGCVDVGGKCRGNNAHCCSGICQGKKPKKGKKDRSQCVAHNVGTCLVEQDSCGGPVVPCGGPNTACFRTTGKASFCAGGGGDCLACTKDAECEPFLGPGAACIVCFSCAQTGGTGCVPPGA